MLDFGIYIKNSFKGYPLDDKIDSLSCQPLFIISAGRSGTTLLRSMLVSQGEIAIPPETWSIPVAIRRYQNLRHLGWGDTCRLIIALFESTTHFHLWGTNLYPVYQIVINLPIVERSLARIIDEIFVNYWQHNFPAAKLWGDKSTINTLHIPRIYKLFPRAKYLHLLRDSRDAISSMIVRGRKAEQAINRWMTSIELAVWLQNQVEEEQFLEIRYESLVTDPKSTLNKICKFTETNYDDIMLDFWKSPTTIEHHLYEHHRNISKQLFDKSFGIWKERLTVKQQDLITSRTEHWLAHFGYDV
jgi:hypothetical protein